MKTKNQKTIAIFASGNGTNLEAILRAIKSKRLSARVAFCFSDNPNAKALERAKRLGFETVQFSPKDFASKEAYEAKLTDRIEAEKVDLIILAGYMRLLGENFVKYFAGRIINIHPSLLPSFKGMHAIQDAWNYGVSFTGVTIHFVNEEMDGGPVIAQKTVSIQAGDSLESLEKRVHKVEHALYPATIKKLLVQKFKIQGRRVIFSSLSSRTK